MILYHGSNIKISEIDLSRSKRGKDFGRGFYLNANMKQAMDMAVRTSRTLGEGSPVISAFDFDIETAEADGLDIKVFPDYSEEWAEFVVRNRKNNTDKPIHEHDIVIGPIADDTVGVQIRRYIMGYMSASALVKELRFNGDRSVQYCFATLKSLKYLTPVVE